MLLLAFLLLWQQATAPAAATGVIAGQLRGVDGQPASRVRVAVADDTGTLVSQGQTDASGNYQLTNIPPGRYYVTAGLIELPTYFPGALRAEEARTVIVTAAGAATGVDFALLRAAGVRVSGRVQGLPPGVPTGLIRAMLARVGGTGPMLNPEAPVATDGAFAFDRIAPGSYTLRSTATQNAVMNITVADQDISDLVLSAPASVLGRVTVEDGRLPGPGLVRVSARRAEGFVGPISVVSADGVFLLAMPGDQQGIGVISLPIGYGVKSISDGGEIRIVLTASAPGVTVSGRVNGLPANIPTEGRRIFMQSSSDLASVNRVQRTGETFVRNDGTFEIGNVPPGTYTVRLLTPGAIPASLNVLVENLDVRGLELNTSQVNPPTTVAVPAAATPQPIGRSQQEGFKEPRRNPGRNRSRTRHSSTFPHAGHGTALRRSAGAGPRGRPSNLQGVRTSRFGDGSRIATPTHRCAVWRRQAAGAGSGDLCRWNV
jgi:hypothetical protein